jgi:hypothetical protein
MVFLAAPGKINGGRSGIWTPSPSKSLRGEVFVSFRREHVQCVDRRAELIPTVPRGMDMIDAKLSDGTFGKISGANLTSARVFQGAVKLTF